MNAGPKPTDRIKAKAPAKRLFASTILMLEAFVVLFATLAAFGLRNTPSNEATMTTSSPATLWLVGGGLAVVLFVLSRALDYPGGYIAGTLVQVPVLAFGLLVTMMYIVGAVFIILWIMSIRMGAKIDRERAIYDAEHPETAPNISK